MTRFTMQPPQKNYMFTVFTPTYNRVKDLNVVYESLKKQSFTDFEWIIVDDGSTDETNEVVKQFMQNASFDIKYLFQKNSGKHVAQNRAVDMAEGELFLPLDSDDIIVENGLEILNDAWNSIPKTERGGYSGIGCHCMNQYGELVGDPWPEDGFVSNDLEIQFKYKIKGEKWGPIRTDIMRNYKNDEVKGHFLSESTVWFRIANNYKKKYIADKLRVYVVHEDSVTTKMKNEVEYNSESFIHSQLIYINEFYDWYWKYDKKAAIKLPLSLLKATIKKGDNIVIGQGSLISKIKPKLPKFIVFCFSPYKIMFKLKSAT